MGGRRGVMPNYLITISFKISLAETLAERPSCLYFPSSDPKHGAAWVFLWFSVAF